MCQTVFLLYLQGYMLYRPYALAYSSHIQYIYMYMILALVQVHVTNDGTPYIILCDFYTHIHILFLAVVLPWSYRIFWVLFIVEQYVS